MRAVVYDGEGVTLGTAPQPVPGDGQALVDVRAVSLNFTDVAHLDPATPPGTVLGLDAAGVVRQAAADGSGPEAGARVVTFGWGRGAWAETRAADTRHLAVLPEGVGFAEAAALPAAGVTALRALRQLGPVAGRRVLVTGASGGVGRFAVQLAALAGAYVVAAVGSPERGAGLRTLGAREVVTGLADVSAPFHGVLENVGGPLLGEAFALLEPGGSLQSIGAASGRPSTLDLEAARRAGGARRLEVFAVGTPDAPFGPDLAHLAALVAEGRLDPQIGWRGPWERVREAAGALRERRVAGKAVLEVTAAG
ncbi:zinc-binding dehydrogenase [Streptomyces sp. NPDC020983]|uniref:zinc-binding dehydrogenase n=1 Tax=Streptomyces sp. NPDC020983 TaxID=3365106 RepID=UPI0037B4F1AA